VGSEGRGASEGRPGRERGAAGWRGWGAALGLALVIWGALLALAGRTTLWDRDEPRFAQATVEMIHTGGYLVPVLNGRLRPDKPILVYWLMSLPIRWLGPTALAARAWSAFAVALTALLTFGVARRLVGGPAGRWAMAILAATPLALLEGQAATADGILLAAVTAALACFVAALLRNGGGGGAGGGGESEGHGGSGALRGPGGGGDLGIWWPWLGLAAAMALALLAKGPVGLAVPGLGIAVTLWLLRQPSAIAGAAADGPQGAEPTGRARGSLPGSGALAWRAALAGLLGIALFCAWGIPADRASGGELARLGLGRHVLGRALGAMEGHGGGGPPAGILFYLLVLALGFAPWSLYLPAAISAVLGGRIGGEQGRALLIGWTAPVLLLMVVVATRLPNYILPAWPALALAVGGTLDAEARGGLAARDRRWLRRGAWLLAGQLALVASGAVALAVVVIGGRWLTSATGPMAAGAPGVLGAAGTPGTLGTLGATGAPGSLGGTGALGTAEMARDLLPAALALAIVALAAGGAALREHLACRYRRAAMILLGGVVGAALVAGAWAAPVLERWKPAPRLAAAVRAAAAPGLPIVTYGYGEPSLTFYLQRGIVNELGDPAALAAWCREKAPGILILPRSALHDLHFLPASAKLREIAAASGFNVAKGRFLELVALERDGPRSPGPCPHRKPDNPG
jgi:4-amino-4-deoxy-L-arabinose transferase-like glycosyltransferase